MWCAGLPLGFRDETRRETARSFDVVQEVAIQRKVDAFVPHRTSVLSISIFSFISSSLSALCLIRYTSGVVR